MEKRGTQFTRDVDPSYQFETVYGAMPASTHEDYPDWVSSGVQMHTRHTRSQNAFAHGTFKEAEESPRFKALTDVLENHRGIVPYQARHAAYVMQIGEEDIEGGWGRARHVNTGVEGDMWGDAAARARQDLKAGTGPEGGQLKLFGSGHEPAKVTVDLLRSTKSARVHVPTVLALADLDARREHGVGLTASTNRSQFSEALTQHLGKLTGQAMTERESSNQMEFASEYLAQPREALSHIEVSPQDVSAARGTVRSMLRGPRPWGKHLGQQFGPTEQGTLFS